MTLSEAYLDWMVAEGNHSLVPIHNREGLRVTANAADEAFEQMSAIAFQQGYDPAGPLGIVEFVMREIAK